MKNPVYLPIFPYNSVVFIPSHATDTIDAMLSFR